MEIKLHLAWPENTLIQPWRECWLYRLNDLYSASALRNSQHCNSQRDVPVLCSDEWRYDRVVFSIW